MRPANMKILSIETSCDETAIALLEANGSLKSPKFKVLKNIVSSQIKIHAPFGGVVPNLAKREHLKNLPIIFNKILRPKALKPEILAVTVGPGLEPALWTSINFAKEIHKNYFPKASLVGVNHLEGHLYSFLLSPRTHRLKFNTLFPAVALIVSGGHTILLLMKSLINWQKLGETRDDAVGEAFDKVARMLNLPFPGGPEIEKLAIYGSPTAIDFPRPMIAQKNYDFSFSGLKTSVLYYLRDHPRANKLKKPKANVAASFQQAAVDVLISKTIRAAREFRAKSIILAGGVAANKLLRKMLKAESQKLKANLFAPPAQFNTDNAAMIAAAAYIQILQKKKRAIRAQANLKI